ncbi:ribosome maturation factor RimP [candidate division WOR-3 bacterium]|nr:ribosome maturation factor RimP [candidate division WOR-3 bacterium]
MTSQVPSAVPELCRRVSEEQNVEIYHVELAGRVLRVQIDAPGGTSLEACARFSRALSAGLDAAGALPGRYVLEVSSPGVERRLYRPVDFARASGALVRVRTPRHTWEGRLVAADDSTICLACAADAEFRTVTISYAEVADARVVVRDADLLRPQPHTEVPSLSIPDASAAGSADRQKGEQ